MLEQIKKEYMLRAYTVSAMNGHEMGERIEIPINNSITIYKTICKKCGMLTYARISSYKHEVRKTSPYGGPAFRLGCHGGKHDNVCR